MPWPPHLPRGRRKAWLAGRAGPRNAMPLAAAALLSACVVVPQTREVYDAKCRILTKEVVLETAVVGQFGSCRDRDCGLLLATLGVVTAATAVVSGSVAVVGNVVYWFERQGRCLATPPAPAVPNYAPAPAVPSYPPAPAVPSHAPAEAASAPGPGSVTTGRPEGAGTALR